MSHPIKHFITITKHRHLVMKLCFKMGLYKQGLLHDLSKYSYTEFSNSAKYYVGTYSPTISERKEKGYSDIWMHHKGRNKHHFEYWFDFSNVEKKYVPIKIPIQYVKEMICDRIAASKVYLKDKYTKSSALEYFNRTYDRHEMHPETSALLKSWLELVSEKGENEAIKIIKKVKNY
mgnify:FL=1